MFRILTLFVFCFFSQPAHAQVSKVVSAETQTWLAYFNQTRLSKHWGLWLDAHFRLKDDFVGAPASAIVRPGLTYYLMDDVRLTAAYAYVHHFPADGHQNIALPEHRPWQQVQWFARWPKARLTSAIRLEERFRRNLLNDDALGEGYNFNWRARYNAALFVPLTKKGFQAGGFHFLLNNEIFINFGKNIVYNVFDQNRFFAGLVWQASTHSQLHFGYMNVYLQQKSGNAFKNQHAIRVFFFQNFDLRGQTRE